MTNSSTVPVPLDPLKEDLEDKRLWVGNLDPRVTEFTLVKLLQTYGSLEKFDMLFHRSGPLEGQPRGYAFVTYSSKEVAELAKNQLDGLLVGAKNICVKWAHTLPKTDNDKQKVVPEILTLGGFKTENRLSRLTAIKAIEAKLKVMESTADSTDFTITDKPTLSHVAPVCNELGQPVRGKQLNRNKSKPYCKTRRKV